MKKKLRVGVLFGGRSGEHEVSLLSAASVLKAIDRTRYEVVPIGITKQGRWLVSGDAERLLTGDFPDTGTLRAGDPQHTAPAALLAKGEGVIVPPMPAGGRPWYPSNARPLRSPPPTTCCSWMLSFPCCTGRLAKMAPCRACSSWQG